MQVLSATLFIVSLIQGSTLNKGYVRSVVAAVSAGVTGQSISLSGLYPGLNRSRLNYTRAILRPRPIHTYSGHNISRGINTCRSIP